ncbi:hypothetical protein BH10ACT3_BH10ACT3_00170 [soil metagenome]
MDYSAKQRFLSELQEVDWDFTGQSMGDGFSRFHWHPARFLPQLPAILISALSEPGDHVLDPFCGSGTTLVEARLQGRVALGIDTNPVAALIAAAKTAPFDRDSFDRFVVSTLDSVANSLGTFGGRLDAVSANIPNLDEQQRWYHERTLAELGVIWHTLNHAEPAYYLAGAATFSSILREVCSQDKHWGWICDNVTPKTLVYRDAVTSFANKLQEYGASARDLNDIADQSLECRVATGECANQLATEPTDSIDLVVTSPPYFGVTDYAKAQRLSFLWFGFPLEATRQSEAGARSKRRRKTALTEFLRDMEDSFVQIARVLKPGAFCAIVLGESPARAAHLDELEEVIGRSGLRVEQRIERRLPSQRGLIATLKEERILVCRNG